MTSKSHESLLELGARLQKERPHKLEKTPRQIRGILGGIYIFDTCEAVYVWEHPYYPYFYVPRKALKDCKLEAVESNDEKPFWIGKLSAGNQSTEQVLVFEHSCGVLNGLVKIQVDALEAWFAESQILLGPHPKDPYKRVECLPSSREVRIEVDGTVVAQSTQNTFLYETMLRPRYYLNPTSISDWRYFKRTETRTGCPYKGVASYYDLNVNGKEIKDAVWYYEYPTAEAAQIQGLLCFYNEKVDVFLDGVKEGK